MNYRSLWIAIVFIAAVASSAAAQDAGQWGVTVAAPGSAGVHRQVSDKWAIRADVDYDYSKTVFESGVSTSLTFGSGTEIVQVGGSTTRSESSTHGAALGLSALVTLHQKDGLRLYLAPRIGVSFTSSRSVLTTETIVPPNFPPGLIRDLGRTQTVEDSSVSPVGGASVGASTTIGARFGIFGEAGLLYSRMESSQSSTIVTSLSSTTITRSGFGTTGRVGVMLLF